MKLQHLAVIFVLIIIPISMVLSEYVNTQISTIKLQTEYTTSLNTATSDALKAFQINSVNNKYSNLSDSKIRDIEASVNTFYNSLGTAMNEYVTSKEDLSTYVPAMLFTLYDGYYIHSSYDNVYASNGESNSVVIQSNNNYQKGLRPYIYYSCQYRLENGKNVIVNFTLDNAITVYGDFGNGNGYETKSGYLINYNKVTNKNSSRKTLNYDGVEIRPESLMEHLSIITDEEGEPVQGDYPYIVYNNKKVYMDVDESGNAIYDNVNIPVYDSNGNPTYDGYGNIRYRTISSPKFFWYDNYKKTYLQGDMAGFIKYLTDNNLLYINGNNRLVNNIGYKSISAYEYYTGAYEFSKWVVEKSGLKSVIQTNIVQNDGTIGSYKTNGELYLSADTKSAKIFDPTLEENDPLLSSSTFNSHRIAVIRKSIETNLTTAIANYNKQSGLSSYEFVMPIIDEENWYKIANNVSLISFMQGIPIGHKIFNNYSVVTNTNNEETINEQSIYLVVQNADGNYEYHQPGCKELIEKQKDDPELSITAYTALSFMRQTVKLNEVQTRYFYPQQRTNKLTTGCYNCIVNASGDYDIDSIISGQIKDFSSGKVVYNSSDLTAVRRAFLTGLARERRDLYKSNFE